MSYYVFPASRGTSISSGGNNMLFTSPPLVSPPLTYSVALGSRYGHSASAKARYEQLGWEEITPPNNSRRQTKSGDSVNVNVTVAEGVPISNSIHGNSNQSYRGLPVGFGFGQLINGKYQQHNSSKKRRNATNVSIRSNGNTTPTNGPSNTRPTSPDKARSSRATPKSSSSVIVASTGAKDSSLGGLATVSNCHNGETKVKNTNATAPRSVLAELLAQQEEERHQRQIGKELSVVPTMSPSKAARLLGRQSHVDPTASQTPKATTIVLSTPADSASTPPTERSLHFELAAYEEDPTNAGRTNSYSKRNSSELATPTMLGRKRSSTVAFEDRKAERNNSTSSNHNNHGENLEDKSTTPISLTFASPASPNTTNPQGASMVPYFTQILIDQCATSLQRQKQQQQLRIVTQSGGSSANNSNSNAFVAAIAGGAHNSSNGTPSPSTVSILATPKRYRLRGSGLELSNSSFPSSGVPSRMVSRLDTPTPTDIDLNIHHSHSRHQKGSTVSVSSLSNPSPIPVTPSKEKANTSASKRGGGQTVVQASSRPPTGSSMRVGGHNTPFMDESATPSVSANLMNTSDAHSTIVGSKPGSLLLKFHLNRKEMAAKTSLVTNQPIDGSNALSTNSKVNTSVIPTMNQPQPLPVSIPPQNEAKIVEKSKCVATSKQEELKNQSVDLTTVVDTRQPKPTTLISIPSNKPPTPTSVSQPNLYVSAGRNASNLSNNSNQTSSNVWEMASVYGSRAGSLLQSPPKATKNVWDEVFEME